MSKRPTTIEAAVAEVLSWPWATRDQTDLLRAMPENDLVPLLHFSLGLSIRNKLGLWGKNESLLKACNVSHADDASSVILMALRDYLIRTANPEDMQRSQGAYQRWKAEREERKQKRMDHIAETDARMTSRRCPFCGKPCPTYRATCKHCGETVGRGPTQSSS